MNTIRQINQNEKGGLKVRSEQLSDGRDGISLKEDNTLYLKGFEVVKPFKFPAQPYEYKVTPLRECPTPENMQRFDSPNNAAEYWNLHVTKHPYFNPECECLVVLMLNARRRVKGHYLVSTGTLDSILSHPREVFRLAIAANASALVVMHNHPSGEPQPSEADIRITRDLIRAGQLLRIEVIDHVIVGNPGFCSLRELGFFSL